MTSLSAFIPISNDIRSQRARELLDADPGIISLYKVPRAGATTSMCSELMRRGETFTIIEPTNRINKKTLEKMAVLSGTGKLIIPILSNENCIINKTSLLKDHPEVSRLGILPLQQCEDKDGGRCPHYDRCPITRPLREVIGIGGYAITYQKLVALSLSPGAIAGAILSMILSTDHLIFDEAHTIRYPDTISVQVHPEIDLSKYYDLNYPGLPDVVSGFTDILANASDAIEQIKQDTPEYTHKHLAHPITMEQWMPQTSNGIAVGISSLINLMIHRDDHGLSIEDVVLLKDMLLLCAEKKHVVHGVISTKADGKKKLRIAIETTDATFRIMIRKAVARYRNESNRRVWLTSGTMPHMDGVLPAKPVPLMFGDPLDTNSMIAVITDRRRVSVKTLRDQNRFKRIITDIRNIVDRFGEKKCAVCVMNKKWYDKIIPGLRDYASLETTWYGSDLTVGVESDRRIWIAVGLAEKPKNAFDAVALSALSRSDDDLMAVSDRLRNERVHIDTWQAWSRAKDPEAKVRSVVVALGCNAEDVRNAVTWRVNRKLEVSGVKKTTGGSRIHYDVLGDEMIGSEIPIIPRGKNNDINELVSNWLDKGSTTPLTCKMFDDFFKKHDGEKMSVRDIHQGMHLSRNGINQKDVGQFLSENADPVTKNPYIMYLGKSGNKTLVGKSGNKPPSHEVSTTPLDQPQLTEGQASTTVPATTLVGKSGGKPPQFQPLTPQDIRNHYRHPLVATSIMQHSIVGSSWRAGNYDFFGWWKRVDTRTDKLEKLFVLPDHNDYYLLIDTVRRTLYWTLNFFEDSISTEERPVPESGQKGVVVGEYKTTVAYSLGVDIDHTHGSDVFRSKAALEAAAKFFIDRLHDIGIKKSYDVLFSGGGIYIHIHPEITVCPTPDADRITRERWFYLLTETYNKFINHTQQRFYGAHPEYKSLVKFDALNNSKRVFKSLFSIHKKHPFACVPLDKNEPVIDFDAAHPPLSDDVIKTGVTWLSDYDINERQKLVNALQRYEEEVKEKRSPDDFDTEIMVSDTPVVIDDFPPCVNAILNTYQPGAGATRMISFLSAYLFQVGWSRQQALVLVFQTAERYGMDRKNAERYFNDWFGKLNCPSCDTIRQSGTHYPHMNMGELGICKPDHDCDSIYNPIRYKNLDKTMEIEI